MNNKVGRSHPMIITPIKRVCCDSQKEYLREHTRPGYTVPDKVIAYLRAGNAYMACPGIYAHPYRPGVRLLGPEYYTDGQFCWDRDTWKYVLKYGFVLPQEFIDHVMSDAGTAFIEEAIDKSELWCDAVKPLKKKQGFRCFLPDSEEMQRLEGF